VEIIELIDVECENIKQMLISKNQQYGNSDAGEDSELDLIGYLILKRVLSRVNT
jgi:hypothetical protein